MAYWLLKTEPSDFSFSDLQRSGRTVWSGIKNAAALLNVRKMQVGDAVLIYHTGTQRAIVGVAKVVRAAYLEKAADAKSFVVDIVAEAELPKPVTLAAVKAEGRLKEWALVKIGRLSVVPTSPQQWAAVRELAGG